METIPFKRITVEDKYWNEISPETSGLYLVTDKSGTTSFVLYQEDNKTSPIFWICNLESFEKCFGLNIRNAEMKTPEVIKSFESEKPVAMVAGVVSEEFVLQMLSIALHKQKV